MRASQKKDLYRRGEETLGVEKTKKKRSPSKQNKNMRVEEETDVGGPGVSNRDKEGLTGGPWHFFSLLYPESSFG